MLPDGIPTVTVTGRFLTPEGTPLTGQIVFRAPALITIPEYDVILGGPVVEALDAQGGFSVELLATDAPGMNPADWSYTVTEQLAGVAMNRAYQMLLPAATPVVDLADVAPADPTTPTYVPVIGPQGPQGEQGVRGSQVFTGTANPTSVLGADGDVYTQYTAVTKLSVTSTTVTMWSRAAGTWAKVGGDVRGAQWYVNAAGTPSNDTPLGDMLLRSDTGDVYQRGAPGWELKGSIKGPQGVQGVQGDTGSLGPVGPAGSQVYAFANGTESQGVGVAGDFAIRTDTGILYQYVAPSGWASKGSIKGPQGIQGIQGVKGDTGAPGTGSGTVTAVNTVAPNGAGNVTLTAAHIGALATATRGAANGVASLDTDSKVPLSQLAMQYAIKTSDTSKTNSTSRTADPHLTIPVVAGGKYLLDAVLVWSGAGGSAGGFNMGWLNPASGTTMAWTDNDGSGYAGIGSQTGFSITSGTTLKGLLEVGTANGSITVAWAQNTAHATSTTLQAGSYLCLQRIA